MGFFATFVCALMVVATIREGWCLPPGFQSVDRDEAAPEGRWGRSVLPADVRERRAAEPRALPPGRSVLPPGRSVLPADVRERRAAEPDTLRALPPGRSALPPGRSALPPGRSALPPGRSALPPGRSALPPDRSALPPGRSALPPGRSALPPGRSALPPGRSALPPGRSVLPADERERRAAEPDTLRALPPGRSASVHGKLAPERRRGRSILPADSVLRGPEGPKSRGRFVKAAVDEQVWGRSVHEKPPGPPAGRFKKAAISD